MPGGGISGMGTAIYFMKKEDERIDRLHQRRRRRMERKARRAEAGHEMAEARLDEVEADLGRTVLLAMTVNQLLLEKGVLTQAEIDSVGREVDLVDGVADGKLNPAFVRPPTASMPAETPEDFLRQLEREET
jgi:hypothetical protein